MVTGVTSKTARTRSSDTRDVVYGRNPVRELVRAARREVREVRATAEAARDPWLAELGPRIVDRAELGRLAGTGDHQGVAAIAAPYPYADVSDVLAAPGPVLCLDRIQDPRNLGAVARVVDAVGGAGIVIPRRGTPEVTGAVCKTSAGAIEHILLARVENIAAFLHDARGTGRWAIGADNADEAEDFRQVDLGPDSIVVVGAEGEGLRPRVRSTCDRIARIPMSGSVESLNLSVSAALLLYEAVRSQDSRK